MAPTDAVCSFCKKSPRDVGPLVEGPDDVYICEECAELCQSIVKQEKRRRSFRPKSTADVPSIEDVIEGLDHVIHGLAEVKRIIASVVHRHYQSMDSERTDHNDILVIGPQSSGLLFARALGHLFRIPVADGDASSIKRIAEMVSEPVESIYFQLLESAEFDLEATQRGIIYLHGTDVPSVWPAMIDALQRRVVNAFPNGPEVDTRNILFICSGQFAAPDDSSAVTEANRNAAISFDELVSLGIDRNLATFFGAAVRLPPLDEETLIRVVGSANVASLSNVGVE